MMTVDDVILRGEALNHLPRERLRAILEANSAPSDQTGCIRWTGYTASNGYGRLRIDQLVVPAHRAAWVAEHGPMPLTCDACHLCDRRDCVNPHHIFAASRRANMIDAKRKKRLAYQISPKTMARGERHGHAKLTAEQVAEIRASKERPYALARLYPVDESTIRRVIKGEIWKSVLLVGQRSA